MPSAPMTAQMQRTTGFWLVRFPCCGKRFPNQTQAVRHLVQAHGYDPTQAIQHCQALAQAVRLESREMLGIMPPQASPHPQGPCLSTSA
jgi:uncharacterized C2H2 Zn-finger protein